MRRRGAVFILLSLAGMLWSSLAVLAQTGPGPAEKEFASRLEPANSKFLKGKDYFAKKELVRAEAELRACLEILPQHADALFLLAQTDYLKGDLEDALADVQKAENSHSAYARAYIFLDVQRRKALLEERKTKEEEVDVREAALNNDLCKTERGRITLAETIDTLRREISAINAKLDEPLPTEPRALPADYSYLHGNILFKMNRFQEAGSQYLKAIEADAGHFPAYNNLINLYYVTRDYEKALMYPKQAEANGVGINPKLKEAILQIAKK